MATTTLFLDTSIQVSRKGHDDAEVAKIEGIIDKYDFISTSSYVRLEFKQSYIQDLVYLHKNLVKEKSFCRALTITKDLNSHIGGRRKISSILESLCKYFSSEKSFHSDDAFDKDLAYKIELYLEGIIEKIWEWFEEKSVDHISDATECIRSKEPPRKKALVFDARIKKCKSENIRCKLNEFFHKNEDEFKKIKEYIEGLKDPEKKKPEELNRIASIIEEGIKNPNNLYDSKNCKGLGDALVAVESKSFNELFTKDVDQSKVICEAISLKSILL
ncbi:MAG: hypothetical protein V2A72_04410 [Candidatus Omnitrophota bacterium]